MKFTKEQRKKISEGRKKFLRENPDKHPWKNHKKFESKPCNHLKHQLGDAGFIFIEEYNDPLLKRNFSLDIAFPDIKFAIEVNGNQHYNRDGTLTEYYQKRHDYFVEHGWYILELHYSKCYDENIINEILLYQHIQPNFEYCKAVREYNENKRLESEEKINEKIKKKIKKKEKIKNIIQALTTSSIDFKSFGWVNEASKIIGISPQKVGKWMNRNCPEFYETCYKRKKGRRFESFRRCQIVIIK